ncbi:hypothetical protein BC629DRAFT_1021594 [Irpex lacteus]|nr:hypothetical protein BC629DRAFT_1021594 [Irpex lacteus]
MNWLAEASLCMAGMLDAVLLVVVVLVTRSKKYQGSYRINEQESPKGRRNVPRQLCFLCADRRSQEFGIMGVEY